MRLSWWWTLPKVRGPDRKAFFEVVKHRNIPVLPPLWTSWTVMAEKPLDLLQELERVLGMPSYPMNWPIGMGKCLRDSMTFTINVWSSTVVKKRFASLDEGDRLFDLTHSLQVLDDIELLAEAGNKFQKQAVST